MPERHLGNVVAIYGRAFLRKIRNEFLFSMSVPIARRLWAKHVFSQSLDPKISARCFGRPRSLIHSVPLPFNYPIQNTPPTLITRISPYILEIQWILRINKVGLILRAASDILWYIYWNSLWEFSTFLMNNAKQEKSRKCRNLNNKTMVRDTKFLATISDFAW
jgi:hypothetical protein